MSHEEYWYAVVQDDHLRQGDIFRGVVAFFLPQDLQVPPPPSSTSAVIAPELNWTQGDWIVLEASCDVDHTQSRPPYCSQVLIAPVFPASKEKLRIQDEKQYQQKLEVLRRGLHSSKFLLSAFSEIQPQFPLSYVEYREHLLLPHAYLLAQTGAPRLRLQCPHRERFGNWVGECISRVGPEDEAQVPSFTGRLHDGQILRVVEDG